MDYELFIRIYEAMIETYNSDAELTNIIVDFKITNQINNEKKFSVINVDLRKIVKQKNEIKKK